MLYMFRTMLVHRQEQPFISCTSHLVYADTIRVAVVQQPHVWYKSLITQNFVHLVGLYTYCKMMRGAYDVKLRQM